MSDRRKPGVAFWAIVGLVVVLISYPLSFGPACRMAERDILSTDDIESAYRPIVFIMTDGPQPWRNVIFDYASVCGGHETAQFICLLASLRSVEPEYLGDIIEGP